MPNKKSNLSTTTHTRILAAMPSKVYLAMHLILGGADSDARIKINELARALVLKYFLDEMEGKRFLTSEEVAKILPMTEIQKLDFEDTDWFDLEIDFKDRGNGNPGSMAYVVNSIDDLEANAGLAS